MTRFRRALFGAAVGSLTVLFLHPASRAYYLGALIRQPNSTVRTESPWLLENLGVLPQPSNEALAAYWMAAAAEIEQRGTPLDRLQREKLLKIARAFATREPDNAFWSLALSVFGDSFTAGRGELSSWLRASNSLRYNDHQTERLRLVLNDLRIQFGGEQSWMFPYLQTKRSSAFAELVEAYGRRVCRQTIGTSSSAMRLRYATLVNGWLLRDGSRSNRIAQSGIALIEAAAQLPDMQAARSQRDLALARAEFSDRLSILSFENEAKSANQAFSSNESWTAFLSSAEADDPNKDRRWASVVLASLPASLIVTTLVGAALVGLAQGFRRLPFLRSVFTMPWCCVGAVAAGIGIYAGTRLLFPALAAASGFAVFAVTPERLKSRADVEGGFGYRVTLALVGLSIVAPLAAFWVFSAGPARLLSMQLGANGLTFAQPWVLLGVASMGLGAAVVAAPAYGFVMRRQPADLLATILGDLGQGIFVASLIAAIVAGPIAIAADRAVRQPLRMAFENEPGYTMNRYR